MHQPRAPLASSILLVVVVLGGSAGCGTDASAPDGGSLPDVDAACAVGGGAPPWLVLGTGQASFVDLAMGSDIELIHGPQGGYHLYTTALFGLGVSPDAYVLRYDVRRTDGSEIGTTQVMLLERRLARACGGWFRGGDFVVLSIVAPADVVDQEVDVVARVFDGTMEIASDMRRVRIVDLAP